MSSPHPAPSPQHLSPLTQWEAAARSALIGVFTDIDDTLTTEGAITPDALQAMGALHAAGLNLVAITGRPVGWSEPFASVWPVDAIVAENGAVALVRTAEGRIEKRYQQDAATRARNFERMQAVLARIEREIPGARRATDSAGPRMRHRHRPQRIHAARRRDHRAGGRPDAQRRHARHRQQHPHQRLVRRAQQAGRRPLDRARALGPSARRRDAALGLRGRFDQRRADVRAFRPQRRASPTCAASSPRCRTCRATWRPASAAPASPKSRRHPAGALADTHAPRFPPDRNRPARHQAATPRTNP